MFGSLKDQLSVLMCKYYFDGFHGTEIIDLEDEKKVYLFDGFYAGLNTIWGDLLLNRMLLEEGMEKALERVLLHERQHGKESSVFQAIGGSLQMLLHPFTLMINSLVMTALLVHVFLVTDPLNPPFGLTDRSLVVSILTLYAVAAVFSNISELRTDLEVVRKMGVDSYKEGSEQVKQKFPEPGLLGKVSLRLTHPKPEFVVRVFNFLNER